MKYVAYHLRDPGSLLQELLSITRCWYLQLHVQSSRGNANWHDIPQWLKGVFSGFAQTHRISNQPTVGLRTFWPSSLWHESYSWSLLSWPLLRWLWKSWAKYVFFYVRISVRIYLVSHSLNVGADCSLPSKISSPSFMSSSSEQILRTLTSISVTAGHTGTHTLIQARSGRQIRLSSNYPPVSNPLSRGCLLF